MRILFTVIITIFFILSVNSQTKDSISLIKSANIVKCIDTIKIFNKIDLTGFDLAKVKKSWDTIKISEFVSINRKLLDSLLKPYYVVSIDILTKDTIFTPRYRMMVDAYSQDTTYIKKPKEKNYIEVVKSNGINTLEIINPINKLKIKQIKMAKDPVWWNNKNSIGLDINEVAFVNWNAGGSNSISGLLKIYFERNFEKIHTLWENKISARYGLNEQEDKGLIKTDDEIRLSSSYGYRKDTISNWYYSVKLNFKTQFTNGYKYPDTETPISRFFAPAYLFLGVGTHYNLKSKNFSVYLSPITVKSTYVLDDNLSNEGAFGVEKGKKSRHEFGTLVQSSWVTEIFKNVAMTNQLGLYTDYLNNFGNIDVDWILRFQFKINDFLEANLRTHLIYDDDIKYKEDTNGDGELETFGARVQFKQQLGIGVLYNF